MALLLAGALGGAAVAHEAWRPRAAATAAVAPAAGGQAPAAPPNWSGGAQMPPNDPLNGGGTGTGGTGSDGAGPTDAAAIAHRVDPGVVDINTTVGYQNEQAAGTGMVLTSTGEVLTNNHVISGATSISVTDVGNGKTYAATVVGYDKSHDVAVLQLQGATGLTTVTTASSPARVGAGVVGVGNAGGTGGTPSYAGGVITAVDQTITASDSSDGTSEQLTGLLETNANIVAGDSGGPLVNEQGEVVGMNTAASSGYRFSATSEAYAIPISTALTIAHEIVAGEASSTVHVGPTAMLGVGVQPDASYADPSDPSATTAGGAIVVQVLGGGPAARAGLSAGDTITAIAGRTISSASSLSRVILQQDPGTTVTVRYVDPSGNQHTVKLRLAAGPPQ